MNSRPGAPLMVSFDPQAYGPRIAPLVDTDRCRPLDGGSGGARKQQLFVDDLFAPGEVVDQDAAMCCAAGVLLLSDQLDASHNWSQQVETPEGSFWHGIMHRREGDYSNAKYWFRRVGSHPVYELLGARGAAIASELSILNPVGEGTWDPMVMVDACQRGVRTGVAVDFLRAVQQAEWELLFDHCYHLATRT